MPDNPDKVTELPEIGGVPALGNIYYGFELKPELAPELTCPNRTSIPCSCDDSRPKIDLWIF